MQTNAQINLNHEDSLPKQTGPRCPFHEVVNPTPSDDPTRPIVPTSESVVTGLSELITQPNYPCVAALKSFHKKDFRVGIYKRFGRGESWRQLRHDLENFVEEQKKSKSIYFTYFAAFEAELFSEDEFETALWNELSSLTSVEQRESDWIDLENSDPASKNFRFSLSGTEFFVVGLHQNSSRKSRQFPYPMLIFNVFDQFEELERRGQYEDMVAVNRARDVKFQGSVNPMVEEHGDKWEPIQFSGKENSDAWKCPFHFMRQGEKVSGGEQ